MPAIGESAGRGFLARPLEDDPLEDRGQGLGGLFGDDPGRVRPPAGLRLTATPSTLRTIRGGTQDAPVGDDVRRLQDLEGGRRELVADRDRSRASAWSSPSRGWTMPADSAGSSIPVFSPKRNAWTVWCEELRPDLAADLDRSHVGRIDDDLGEGQDPEGQVVADRPAGGLDLALAAVEASGSGTRAGSRARPKPVTILNVDPGS